MQLDNGCGEECLISFCGKPFARLPKEDKRGNWLSFEHYVNAIAVLYGGEFNVPLDCFDACSASYSCHSFTFTVL